MLARFFIDRPVLAWVISVVIILLGVIAAVFLPVAEYPEITPPTVRVTANYPGANAQVVADSVAAPMPPSRMMTMEITHARTGRSMKKRASMIVLGFSGRVAGLGRNNHGVVFATRTGTF